MKKANIIKLDLPANYDYLSLIDTTIATMLEQVKGLTEPETVHHDIQLAAHEVCTNIIRHAYPQQRKGRIEATLMLKTSPRCFIAIFQDTGLSFNPAEIPTPNIAKLQEGGFGVYIIRNLMDEVSYSSNCGSNHWRLVKNF